MPAIILVGCSSTTGGAGDSGPRWPDGVSDQDAADDAKVSADSAVADVAAPDTIRADATLGDLTFDGDLPAAGPWKIVSTPATADLHGVACVADHVFAVGHSGTILHRAPGLAAFEVLDAQTTADLYAVTFADSSHGVVAGNAATIWKTEDLGQSWAAAPQCSAYVFDTFYSLHLHSATEGFAAGIAVGGEGGGVKYFNSGSWTCVAPTYQGEVFYDVFRLGDSGWTVGDTGGKIYRTEDKGLTWTAVASGAATVLRGVYFAGAQLGLAVGDGGTILRSVDGKGEAWAKITSPTSVDLYDVHFWDGQSGWAVGAGGTVLHTIDAGATWQAQGAPTKATLEGVCFTSAKQGWVVGAGGVVLQTTTAGL